MKFLITTCISSMALVLYLCITVSAQNFTIQGRVIDAESKEPVPFATVYINQTTNGTTSDAEGNFMLNVPQEKAELVISFVGYQPIIYPIDATQQKTRFTFELQPQAEVLTQINVRAKRDAAWYANYATFKGLFLGKSEFAQQAEILNDTSLIIIYDEQSRLLTVKAREPIQVENKALGYTVRYLLDSFEYNLKSGYVTYAGYPFFEPMEGGKGKQKRWAKNREIAYNGSNMHFLRSVYRNTLTENQFVLHRLKRIPNPDRPPQQAIDSARAALRAMKTIDLRSTTTENSVLRRASLPKTVTLLDTSFVPYSEYISLQEGKRVFHFNDYFQVVYQGEKEEIGYIKGTTKMFAEPRKSGFQTSVISIINEEKTTEVTKEGTTTNPFDLLLEGYFSYEKVGDMLPLGYGME